MEIRVDVADLPKSYHGDCVYEDNHIRVTSGRSTLYHEKQPIIVLYIKKYDLHIIGSTGLHNQLDQFAEHVWGNVALRYVLKYLSDNDAMYFVMNIIDSVSKKSFQDGIKHQQNLFKQALGNWANDN